jgi:hypothetical protein
MVHEREINGPLTVVVEFLSSFRMSGQPEKVHMCRAASNLRRQ